MATGPAPRRSPPQVEELCTGRTLLDVISAQAPLQEERAATLFRGVIKSVLHCHQVLVLSAQSSAIVLMRREGRLGSQL